MASLLGTAELTTVVIDLQGNFAIADKEFTGKALFADFKAFKMIPEQLERFEKAYSKLDQKTRVTQCAHFIAHQVTAGKVVQDLETSVLIKERREKNGVLRGGASDDGGGCWLIQLVKVVFWFLVGMVLFTTFLLPLLLHNSSFQYHPPLRDDSALGDDSA